MKRIAISALALSMMAATALPGMAAPFNAQAASHSTVTQVDWKKPNHRKVQKRVIRKKHNAHRSHWRHGQKYSNWKRHRAVDWRRHHLRHPGPGQRWIQVGNEYLLVSILTGVIAGMAVAN
jgi:Ni/Co efflux regulator RcnB